MNKEKIIEKYRNKILGRDNLNREIHINRLLNGQDLRHFLYNMYGSGDESLTGDGLNFLKEYYGLDKIAAVIMEEKSAGIDYEFKHEREIYEWLEQFKTFE